MASATGVEAVEPVSFGRRKVRPRVCITEEKQSVRTFLGLVLEEFGFFTCECEHLSELGTALSQHLPDLIVFGISGGGVRGVEILNTLASHGFAGKVLLFGPRNLPAVAAVRELGESLGLVVLPTLATPFDDASLRKSIASLLPIKEPPAPPVDVPEALSAGWLELWYQPKIDTQTLELSGVEALARLRHPNWGIVSPAHFIPADGDPHFRALSEFVIDQAMNDWQYFLTERGHIEIAINLPLTSLQSPQSTLSLCQRIPTHPAFEGLVIEINAVEALRDLALVQELAGRLRFYNIGLSIDDLGAEWPSLMAIRPFPFAEIKVNRKFVAGCANDRLKQATCRQILDFAHSVGARSVAEGVETRADFFSARRMGFDLAQGNLSGKPMLPRKFAQAMLRHPVTALGSDGDIDG